MKKYNVGLSIHFSETTNIWNNELLQNLSYLVHTLRRIPEIGEIYLISLEGSKKLPSGLCNDLLDFPAVFSPNEITHSVDLVLEVGVSLPLEWLKHIKALGAKVVAFLVGHVYPGQAEASIFDHKGGLTFIGTPWDEIWLLKQHMKTSGSLLRTVARVPVIAVPHLWSSVLVDKSAELVQQHGGRFGFSPTEYSLRRPWRVAIFEPNNTVTKTSFIPMLVCDAAYRSDKNSVGHMMVMNTVHLKEHPTFNRFALRLQLTQDHKASYEPRLAFVECMATHKIDAVVSHQWENPQNYAYYDVLHSGYPLIHNSPVLEENGVGFYYPGFSAKKGGERLLEAWSQPEGFWRNYQMKSRDFLSKLHPEHPENIQTFRDRIIHLLKDRVEKV